jgi:CMP-N,N'-diacetyllegionaminic acid synthase
MNMVGLIPARSGSKRVPDKNIRPLGGHPLLAYSVVSAVRSGVFSRVILSTDSEKYAEIGRKYGAEVPGLRPPDQAQEFSRDFDWIKPLLQSLEPCPDAFAILRPTSPFRTEETIRRAFAEFTADQACDSLRAVQPVSEHPGKMWVVDGPRMTPLLPLGPVDRPWHSGATQALPSIYIQNASLEMCWTRVVLEHGTITGRAIHPFFTVDNEGVDVNTEWDWLVAETLLEKGLAVLPPLDGVSC